MRLGRFLVRAAAVAVVSCGVSGCGAMMHGTYYGVQHSTVGEAEQVRSSARSTALAEIKPLVSPLIARKLTISVPILASLKRYRDAVDPPALYKAAQYARDFYDKDFVDSATFLATAIRQRRLYENVDVVDAEVSAPVPKPTPTNDFIYWKFNPTMWGTQMFFISETVGPFAVTPDNAAPSLIDSTESLIDTLSRLAFM